MISERTFVNSFEDFWRELLPLLTPSFVHFIGSAHEKKLLDDDGSALPIVSSKENYSDSAVISEFAYHLAAAASSSALSVADAYQNRDIVLNAESKAFELISEYKGKRPLPSTALKITEREEGLELAQRYEAFIYQVGDPKAVQFVVPICGAGIINACNMDMLFSDFLVEVKTVKRSLAGKDIRQLVTYMALFWKSKGSLRQYVGFFNPRRSTYHKFKSSDFIEKMSGGKSTVEVFAELINFVCSSDVQLESTF